MDPPRIRLGSPLPVTPKKPRFGFLQDLLQRFNSKASPTSVTQSLKTSKITSPNRQTPNNQEENKSSTMPRELRDRKSAVSYVESNDSQTSPSQTSDFDKPKRSRRQDEDFVEDEEEADDDEEEEVEGFEAEKEKNTLPERGSAGGRSLRSRASLKPAVQFEDIPKSRAGRSQRKTRKHTILYSDTVPTPPKSRNLKAPKPDTARGKVRDEIAAQTTLKRDNFLMANKGFFLPLLPRNNYISKLAANHEDEQPSIVEYRQLDQQPKAITATMKPYQITGLSFLVHLHNNGMSGLLGDEMGLGKTLQTLSLFQYLEESDAAAGSSFEEDRPFLVVCPLSVLSSWVNEARKWVPELGVLRFHGTSNERKRLKRVAQGLEDWYGNVTTQPKKRKGERKAPRSVSKYKIIATTYETFVAEQGWFKHAFVWRYIVLDEGHKIKNSITNISTALQGLKAEYRLILTGTPLQNNLVEMWALLHWLYPEVFVPTTADLFKSSFDLNRGKVSTTVMDDARRLLELIMLRRMKDSPGVNLNLPPKEEILLYVPLTPMQRFWYTRLLTKVGDSMLDDLFSNVKSKEKEALIKDVQEDAIWDKVEELEKVADEKRDEWEETTAIIKQAVEQEQKDVTVKSAWTKLMNLVMQLRKCCSHPYLLPNAQPDPYELGEHVIRASGKFILLEKLLKHVVMEQGKKVLIFSSFTRTLDCCEDLLTLMRTRGDMHHYLRFEGKTARAHRNLAIRMFNDVSSDYKVMLLSTRAGGLGINLTSATTVIFLDEDWNPQITLQAEARAHRIGQTKPVTVYKLCTQGTVEEQMMGRIRKKLYLSAKITESMRTIHGAANDTKKAKGTAGPSTEDMPQMDTSQLKSLVRRGAQTLSHPEIDVTEMLSWDLDTMLEKCRDRPSDPHIHPDSSADAVDEEKWLSAMERVECAVFDGKRYQRTVGDDQSAAKNILPIEITREDRRKGKNTTVMIDGFAINKESLNCADWEAVPTLAGKDPRLADIKREKKGPIPHQHTCHDCFVEGSKAKLIECAGCPRSYHENCLSVEFKSKVKGWSGFFCPQHQCYDCGKKTSDAGGLIFRCRWCPKGYCEDCLDWDKTKLVGDNLPEYEMMEMGPQDQAFYVICPPCIEMSADDEGHRIWVEENTEAYKEQHAQMLKDVAETERKVEEEAIKAEKRHRKELEEMDRAKALRAEKEKADAFDAAKAATNALGITSSSLSSVPDHDDVPSLSASATATPALLESGVSTPTPTLKLHVNLNRSQKRSTSKAKRVPKKERSPDPLLRDSDYDENGIITLTPRSATAMFREESKDRDYRPSSSSPKKRKPSTEALKRDDENLRPERKTKRACKSGTDTSPPSGARALRVQSFQSSAGEDDIFQSTGPKLVSTRQSLPAAPVSRSRTMEHGSKKRKSDLDPQDLTYYIDEQGFKKRKVSMDEMDWDPMADPLIG